MKAAKNIHSFTKYDHGLQTGMIRIRDLRDFSNHPFKVVKDAAMYELMESIRQEGVLVPLLVRPIRMRTEKGEGAGKHMDEKEACHEENRYEIIAGHRRKTAAEWAGLREVPAIVRDLDDDQAVIAMVDSNLQRDHLLPSEKAYAYKMRLEAMKHQGKRLNLPMAQIEPKEESPSTEKNGGTTKREAICNSTKTDKSSEGHTYTPIRSNELLARQVGENVNQIKRYIRLTFLIPQILKMVDEKRLALTSAVEISFLKEEEQYDLYGRCSEGNEENHHLRRGRIFHSQGKQLYTLHIYPEALQQPADRRHHKHYPLDRAPGNRRNLCRLLLVCQETAGERKGYGFEFGQRVIRVTMKQHHQILMKH